MEKEYNFLRPVTERIIAKLLQWLLLHLSIIIERKKDNIDNLLVEDKDNILVIHKTAENLPAHSQLLLYDIAERENLIHTSPSISETTLCIPQKDFPPAMSSIPCANAHFRFRASMPRFPDSAWPGCRQCPTTCSRHPSADARSPPSDCPTSGQFEGFRPLGRSPRGGAPLGRRTRRPNRNSYRFLQRKKFQSCEENISSPIEESQPRPNIDEKHVEATVNVINSTNENNCINTEDPDYIPEFNDDDSEQPSSSYNGRPKKGRKRKFVDQNSSIRKKKANNNEDYFSAKGKKVCAKEFNSSGCRCPLKCTEKISIDQRKKEFEKFWSSGSYEARCAILQGSVIEVKKNRSYSIHSKRAFICKKAFLITLGISQSRIDVALNKFREQAPIDDKRGVKSGGRNAIDEEQLLQIKQFIESLPKYSSHYCRASATFLAPNLNLSIIYDLYKEKYEKYVSFSRFRLSFYKDFNLRFKKPQKDTCLRCDLYKANKTIATGEQLSSLETEHKAHLDHAYKLRDQMKKDLAAAKINDSIQTLTFDLEKTHYLPRLPTSVVYYKRQLNLHNLGIHCGSDGKGYFYIWLEHEAGRGTQEVGSCLKKNISAHLKPDVTQLILWADSCGGQNRSIKMMLMLFHILHNHATLQKITIRFLQPGHTYLPNDSEFGDVECALKSQIRLYTAEDYISVMQNCRRKNKFVVTRLQKDDFKSVTPLQNIITNRKCDENKQKISWLSTFEIELRRDEPLKLFMKSKLEEEPQVIDISRGGKGRKQKSNFAIDLPILYPTGRELSTAKIQDLKELLKLIPTDAKGFYSFLRNAASSDFIDDTEGLGNSVDFDIEENCIED
ncbi:hypothetical protein K1T71_007343 [Dendrolimus kikuchii]|uniref:Uncharacterized protein n=1 Tax=Dendrolimus kikuchii TaxID=765133 RepID=A0ACC1D070_9NEOP|nr:hypothetical protein K1T71_007343 [Dendrolimus kikuchii]